MAELYTTGTNRIVYRSVGFVTGLTVTAYIVNPALEESDLQTFTEVGRGLYRLEYNFPSIGTYMGVFYEGGTAKTSGVFRVTELATAAVVNAEIVDALGTDTLAELSQGVPAATPTMKAALMLIYMALRNKLTSTSSELGIYDDAGTKIAKKILSDDGSTYTEGEMGSGA